MNKFENKNDFPKMLRRSKRTKALRKATKNERITLVGLSVACRGRDSLSLNSTETASNRNSKPYGKSETVSRLQYYC